MVKRWRWLAFEHSPGAYRADFYVYGGVSLALGVALLAGPAQLSLVGWAIAGALGWTLLEYLLHRFVLHGLPPFKRWHAEHHRRPAALIAAPTLLTAAIFTTLLLLPAIWWLGAWPAAALSFGLLNGYLGYGLTHHALHRPAASQRPLGPVQRWLRRRRQWHGLHHRHTHNRPSFAASQGHFGVSSSFWDRVFRTHR
jgi:sterol desaturase/sphingolipid hydroxylase (fatty acid hydroxylase superfamily)